jgi:hypothetical protein
MKSRRLFNILLAVTFGAITLSIPSCHKKKPSEPAAVTPGETWTLKSSGGLYDFRDISNDGTILVAVGDSGRIVTSDSGANWTLRTAPFHGKLNGVASTATYGFVAVSSSGSGDTVLFSDDGATWSARTTALITGNLNEVAGFGSLLIAVGCNGQTYTSSNGVSWTKWTNGGPCVEAVKRCGLDSAQYVAVGESGTIVTSNTGTSWITRSSTGNWLRDVACGCSKAIAVGDGGTIRSSTTGVSWTTVATVGVNLTAVVCSGNSFVAVGENGVVYTSFDSGVTWTERTSPTTKNLFGVTLIGSKYVAVGLDGTVITSP